MKITKKNLKNDKELWEKSSKAKLSTKEILYGLVESPINALLAIEGHKPYSVSAKNFYNDYRFSCERIEQKLYQLKRQGLIKSFIRNNKRYLELTKKGHEVLAWMEIEKSAKAERDKWDGCFRIVMFDIPEDKKTTREVVRGKLESIGFILMQKSVFIYPFDCKKEVDAICYYCNATSYLKYIVAEIVEGEKKLINQFLDHEILTLEQIRKAKNKRRIK